MRERIGTWHADPALIGAKRRIDWASIWLVAIATSLLIGGLWLPTLGVLGMGYTIGLFACDVALRRILR